MPRDNFSRRVARAAAVGGGRTYRAQTPVTWYAALLLVCLVGLSLVTFSRYEREHPVAAPVVKQTPPTATTEWETAVATDVCGKLSSTLIPKNTLPTNPFANIGNGVVQINPGVSQQASLYEGKNAVLGAFLSIEAIDLTSNILSIPGKPVPVTTTTTTTTVAKGKGKGTTTTTTTTTTSTTTTTTTPTTTTAKSNGSTSTSSSTTSTSTSSTTTTTTIATKPGPPIVYKAGEKCGGTAAQLEVETWPSPTSTKGTIVAADKANEIPLKNGELITIAFLPKGTAILQPPAVARNALTQFMIVDPEGVATTTTVAVPSTSSTSSTSTSSTSTTAPKSGSTTTTLAKSTTTSTVPG